MLSETETKSRFVPLCKGQADIPRQNTLFGIQIPLSKIQLRAADKYSILTDFQAPTPSHTQNAHGIYHVAVYQQQSFPSPRSLVIIAQGMDDVIQFSSCSHSGPPILPSTCPSAACRFELDDDPETETVMDFAKRIYSLDVWMGC